jgi:hypothetical protein
VVIKVDRRISYKIVIDTETTPCDKTVNEVVPSNMFAYDIGWAVVDKRGNVYRTRSFVIADIFLDEKELMQSAYYAEKIPKYWEDIKAGRRILTSFYKIHQTLLADMAEFEVTEVFAHNMRFDYGNLNNTQRWLTKSKYRYFFPKDTVICDTLKMARDVVANTPTYIAFCNEHGFLTKNGKPQTKAETLFAYIKDDPDFKESHTGLEDVLIEKEILAYCYRKHKKMRKELWAE